jgi:hypothetical protein
VAGTREWASKMVQPQDKVKPQHLHVKTEANRAILQRSVLHRYDDDPQAAPQVNLTQSTTVPDAAWFLDSDASFHITLDLNCLINYAPYQDNAVARIDNGHELAISHIENYSLDTSKPISLCNVLYVP